MRPGGVTDPTSGRVWALGSGRPWSSQPPSCSHITPSAGWASGWVSPCTHAAAYFRKTNTTAPHTATRRQALTFQHQHALVTPSPLKTHPEGGGAAQRRRRKGPSPLQTAW